MAITSLVLVLAAAVLHALWNALVKESDDGLIVAWGVVVAAALLNIPILVLVGAPGRAVWWIIVVSAVIHVGYNLLLVTAYQRADMAVVYPIARGVAPPVVAVAGIVFLGDSISNVGLIGVALVAGGLALMVVSRSTTGVGWAIATGCTIALYTLVDGFGVRQSPNALGFIGAVFILHAAALTVIVGVVRGPRNVYGAASNQTGRLLFGGAASAAAYLFVMIAARSESLGLVAGLREISAVFGLIIASLFLGETITRRHIVAVTVIVVGAVAIAKG